MGKVKIKKSDIWIDMTPMSDVMVLLLTFFMLTSTFVKNEPIKPLAPGSVSKIKVPEENVLNIYVDSVGKVFMSMDNQLEMRNVLSEFTGQFGISLNEQQVANFQKDPQWGVSKDILAQFLELSDEVRSDEIKNRGIPTDSIEDAEGKKTMSEFQRWVKSARNNNSDVKIAIKADARTPYSVIKNVMSELQDMNENRYFLITQYKIEEDQ